MTSATLRKSGTFVAFSFNVAIDPHQDVFAAALATRRFRTIENAASEEVSAGWVTPEDPSGGSFDLGDMDAGSAVWLRVRIDTKKLPAAWLAQHMAAATRAKGRALTARERCELKDDLLDKLLPRVLPTTRNLDALLFAEKRLVLLFGASKSARETFGKLFFESFGVPLEALGPRGAALRSVEVPNVEAFEQLQPTRWPAAGGAS